MQTDQLKDLIGLHCTSGSVENNGAVLLLFIIRLIMITRAQRRKPGRTWPSSQVDITCEVILLILLVCFLIFNILFLSRSVSGCKKVNDIELTVKISCVQSKTA